MGLSIDFETRSTTDLKRAGVYKYAENRQTDIICLAWAIDGKPVEIWLPGDPAPQELWDHVVAGKPIHAWNAQFERVIWRAILSPRYGFPLPATAQFYCTAAEGAAAGLPRSLDEAAKFLGLPVEKDMDGHRLMLRMSKPRSGPADDPVWWEDAGRMERLIAYCKQDVEVERAVRAKILPLTASERIIYLADQMINDRGVLLDGDLIQSSARLVRDAVAEADREIYKMTGGVVDRVSNAGAIARWLESRTGEAWDVRKATVRDALSREDELPEDVVQVLKIRERAGKSSVAKLYRMIEAANKDWRARGLLLYHGASTGRWTGKSIQPQNFPRGEVKDPEQYIPHIMSGDPNRLVSKGPGVLQTVSSLLRPMIISGNGKTLMAADYSQIEARVLAWLAGQKDLVDVFRSNGPVYELMASKIYGLPVSEITSGSRERQIGKMAVLGCGYGMGWRTFQKQAADQAGIEISDQEAQSAIEAYRSQNRKIKRLWWSVEEAAVAALNAPGVSMPCGLVVWRATADRSYLTCELPSGRTINYPAPALMPTRTPWGEIKEAVTYMGTNAYTRKWERQNAYGGLFVENIVQAIARDLLADAMLRLEAHGFRVVLTVHDEVVCEVDEGTKSLDEFLAIMRSAPDWAEGLPIAAEGWAGRRYRK